MQELQDNFSQYTVKIPLPGIYTEQNLRNSLWVKCIEDKSYTIHVAYSECNENLERLIDLGLNKNFFTRDRWLDIDFIANTLHFTLKNFLLKFDISHKQRLSWHLTSKEKKCMTINKPIKITDKKIKRPKPTLKRLS